jgi:hypothetical protein
MDLGAVDPEMTGDCDGAAAAFGMESISAAVEGQPWGYGFGPMTTDFEDELVEAMGADYAAMGDTPGLAYLRWASVDGDELTEWGYFQVIPFADTDPHTVDVPIEDVSGFTSGVRDSATPFDGLYTMSTVYVLTYDS